MKIQRTIPPVAAPLGLESLLHGASGILQGKKYIKRLEDEIKEYFAVRHVFLVSSGKAALNVLLKSLKALAPEKNEVLIPAYTCFSVPSAIVKAGLKVSLCDNDFSNLDFDYKLLKDTINENTLCVVPSHLFGIPSDINRIKGICKDKGVFIVEDAAQAMGGVYDGRKLGTIGDIGFFSLGRGKNITCGSGGIIVTNSDMIAQAIEKEYSKILSNSISDNIKEFISVLIMSIFINPGLYWIPAGMPFLGLGETIFYKDFPIKKLSGMQAGFLNAWQRKLEESNRIRKENAEYFFSALASTLTFHNGDSIPFLRLPVLLKNKEMRDSQYSLSLNTGLGLSKMYPAPINEIEEIKDQFPGQTFPNAKSIADRLLTLPTHHLLSEMDRKRIRRLIEGEDKENVNAEAKVNSEPFSFLS